MEQFELHLFGKTMRRKLDGARVLLTGWRSFDGEGYQYQALVAGVPSWIDGRLIARGCKTILQNTKGENNDRISGQRMAGKRE